MQARRDAKRLFQIDFWGNQELSCCPQTHQSWQHQFQPPPGNEEFFFFLIGFLSSLCLFVFLFLLLCGFSKLLPLCWPHGILDTYGFKCWHKLCVKLPDLVLETPLAQPGLTEQSGSHKDHSCCNQSLTKDPAQGKHHRALHTIGEALSVQ